MTAKVTLQGRERVAELAHLELTPEETQSMLHDLNAILEHVAQLNELDTTSSLHWPRSVNLMAQAAKSRFVRM